MTIYYEDDQVTLYHGDCLTEHREWLDADVLVTDPPYGMAYQSGQRKGPKLAKVANDATPEARDGAIKAWGAGRPGLLFGTWRVPPPPEERQRLIWSKEGNPGMGDLRMPWGTAHEDIHVIGDGWDREGAKVKRRGSVIATNGVRGGANGEENQTGHPTPKPVALMELLISACPPGVIADPFAGSGATLIAARNLGRKAVGVELEERYCEIIARRLSQGVLDFGGAA